MKKSKILVLALTSVMATSVFGLAGCTGGGGNGGGGSSIEHTQHTYGNWEHNSTQHWRKCTSSGCTAEEREDHKYNGGYTCEVCGYVNESLKPGEPQSMSTYFSGMKTTSTRTSVKDADNVTKSVNEVLDRQLDVLAQDVLYRLVYVYGYNGTSHNRTENAKNTLFNGANAFSYNGNNAVVDSNKLLSSQQNVSSLNSINIDKIDDFQKGVTVLTTNNYLYNNADLNLAGAIEGRNMRIIIESRKYLLDEKTKTDSWNWYSNGNSTYSDIATKANINKMKMAIAQVLINTTVDGNYTVTAYNNALAKIDALGFSNFDSTKLVKFIKSSVIGDTLVNADDNYANTIKTKYSGIINDDSLVDIDNNTTFTSNVATDSPRLYKGYSMVVPAIVKQALSNTFEGTTQTIYPTMSRYATDYSSNVFTTSTSNFDSIVLAPRTSTPATKLVVKIEGTGNNVELTIGCSVNGSNASSNQKKVRLSASGETVEFDLHSYSTIGSYNGSTEKDTNNDLFANNQISKNSSDGSNYIKLVFTNPSNAMFKVTFTGYYNK